MLTRCLYGFQCCLHIRRDLIDTNVISEIRKGPHANTGVQHFFADARHQQWPLFLSAITIGELRRGVELIRHRGDWRQATRLEDWLTALLSNYADHILDIDADIATVWGCLRVPRHESALDKLIAATALIHDLTVVTRNTRHLHSPDLKTLDPFEA